ncbi:MAG: glucose 1-dehydrogenase [Phycisphaerales bacterium]|jgi:NAD(P)-dependent dehydrogenase (short-subunit alcohol dehydrogenase family)|nr:glucose 1-dehydrogenase [Phycisphaerales bacterium]MBT7170238.1 glucose 1-dehydrogenase [Phycisphaerales bacterium]
MGILDKFKLDGKVAVITGSTRGLGKACAIALAEAGANVVITGTTLEPAEAVAAEIAAATGVEAMGLACRVQDKASVDAMIAAILARFGKLDIAFNNAGIATVCAAEDTTEEQFDELMAINVKGVFLTTQAAGKVMLEQGSGSIINMASMSAHIVNLPQQISHYCASKAAVLQYSRSVAAEWADRGVRVNIVSPGYHLTEMLVQFEDLIKDWWVPRIPMGRAAEPAELGGAIVFLASDASSYMTGSEIVTDGGYSLW